MFEYCVILSAGKGSRLNQLTYSCPKALVKLKNKSLISYTLLQIHEKIDSIIVTVGYKKAQVIAEAFKFNITTIVNTSNKNNAWWVFNTSLKEIDKPVLVLPCDNITFLDLDFIYNSYKRLNYPPCMIIPVLANPEIEGDYIHSFNYDICEITRHKKSSIYSSGIQVLNPYAINNICNNGDTDFQNIWLQLIKKSCLRHSQIYPHFWYSVNTESQLNKAEFLINAQKL